jgi:hypothetical protein
VDRKQDIIEFLDTRRKRLYFLSARAEDHRQKMLYCINFSGIIFSYNLRPLNPLVFACLYWFHCKMTLFLRFQKYYYTFHILYKRAHITSI